MAVNSTGVYQKANGYWEYRFVMVVDGRTINRKKGTDEFGNKLKTKREAIRARETAMAAARSRITEKPVISRRTIGEVYAEFCQTGRRDRAYQTIRKQDCIWENHLKARYEKIYVDAISTAEVCDYLAEQYYERGYSYQYTESFLKMFYLIFGQAYSRGYLSVDAYNKLCVNKDTKIRMPKEKAEDESKIIAFSKEERERLDEYFKGKSCETAYLLGRYCGLRINECYGLKWDHVDLEHGTITIDRQMQYQDGLIKLIPPKTRNSKRTIQLCDVIWAHLRERAQQRIEEETEFALIRQQNRRMIEDLDGKQIPSTDLVNCLPDGKIQTVNSFKYPTREIKSKLGINFKYHFLRHTYGTMMAELNTPTHLLCNQMGHSHIHITQRYYLAVSEDGIDILRTNINQL